jgi:hypothetical protein
MALPPKPPKIRIKGVNEISQADKSWKYFEDLSPEDRQAHRDYMNAYQRDRWANDPEFRDEQRARRAENARNAYQNDPEFKQRAALSNLLAYHKRVGNADKVAELEANLNEVRAARAERRALEKQERTAARLQGIEDAREKTIAEKEAIRAENPLKAPNQSAYATRMREDPDFRAMQNKQAQITYLRKQGKEVEANDLVPELRGLQAKLRAKRTGELGAAAAGATALALSDPDEAEAAKPKVPGVRGLSPADRAFKARETMSPEDYELYKQAALARTTERYHSDPAFRQRQLDTARVWRQDMAASDPEWKAIDQARKRLSSAKESGNEDRIAAAQETLDTMREARRVKKDADTAQRDAARMGDINAKELAADKLRQDTAAKLGWKIKGAGAAGGMALLGTDEGNAMAQDDDITKRIQTQQVRERPIEEKDRDKELLKGQGFLSRMLKTAGGAVESAAAIGTSMGAFPFAVGTELASHIRGGRPSEDAFKDTMRMMSYAPRTEYGQGAIEQFGNALDTLKIPPYVPGVGPAMQGAKMAAANVPMRLATMPEGPAAGGLAAQIGAVKPRGGEWSPRSLAEAQRLYRFSNTPEHTAWLEKAATNYLRQHAGTTVDPANALPVVSRERGGPQGTYEQLTDKSIKGAPFQEVPQEMRPPGGRANDMVWDLKPTDDLKIYLNELRPYMRQVPARKLEKMTIPQLLIEANKIKTAESRSAEALLGRQQEAAGRILALHPDEPVIQRPEGSVLRFHKGMDPEYVKNALSVDSCFGGNCLGGGMYNVEKLLPPERLQEGRWVPLRDITKQQKWPQEMVPQGGDAQSVQGRNREAYARDTNTYIKDIFGDKGEVFATRTPEGLPGGAFNTVQGAEQIRRNPAFFVPRAEIRDLIMQRRYRPWQAEQQRLGIPNEQQVPLPGGGFIVPDRGHLGPAQVRSILAMHPDMEPRLAPYLERMAQAEQEPHVGRPPPELKQYYVDNNFTPSPRFSQMNTDLIRQMVTAGKLDNPRGNVLLSRSGVGYQGVPSVDEHIAQLLTAVRGRPGANINMVEQAIERAAGKLEKLKEKRVLDPVDRENLPGILNSLGYASAYR